MKFYIFLLFILNTLFVNALSIEGKNREYAGKELQFFRYSDPVTQNMTPAFTLDFDENGNFSAQISLLQTTFFFCDFGIYRGMLFLEEGITVRLLLPPFREKSFADQKNPYFNPVEFWFVTENGDRITDHAAAFESRLNQLTDRFFNALYFKQSKAAYDSITVLLEQEFGNLPSPAFRWHKKLKMKAVEVDAFRLPAEKVTSVFSGANPEYWTHPAFIQLFSKTFNNTLSFTVRSEPGNTIKSAVSTGDIQFFKIFIKEKYKLTGTLVELTLLKLLSDAYYSGDFSQDDILKLTASSYFRENPEIKIRNIAESVQKKLQHLRKGTKAPVICLKNTDGHNVCTHNENSGKTGKFSYLIFADTEMIVCREHLKYLTRIEELFHKHLNIIVILKKTDLIEMKIFLMEQHIPGIHLVDEKDEYITKYRIKSFPMCFLLNDDHEVVLQQTQAPLDGFELQFGAFLRQKLFENQ
jgi:hypothetical protein